MDWRLLNASGFLCALTSATRVIIVAIKHAFADQFDWPSPTQQTRQRSVIRFLTWMASNGWRGAKAWRERASEIAPRLLVLKEAWRAGSRPNARAQCLGDAWR